MDIRGIDRVASNFDYKNFKLYGFNVDKSSVFYINKKDGTINRFLNPEYSIYLFKTKPPINYSDINEDLYIAAEKLVSQPWPDSPFVDEHFYINFVDKYFVYNIFYKIDNYPNKGKVIGINDLLNKYLLINSHMPNLDYSILSVSFFTGIDFCRYNTIVFQKNDDISNHLNNGKYSLETLTYLHKITKSDLK